MTENPAEKQQETAENEQIRRVEPGLETLDPLDPAAHPQSAVERMARFLCEQRGFDPDERIMTNRQMGPRWEDYLDEAREALGITEDSARGPFPYPTRFNPDTGLVEQIEVDARDFGIGIARVTADGVERVDPEAFYFPGEQDEAPAVAPDSLEQLAETEADGALLRELVEMDHNELVARFVKSEANINALMEEIRRVEEDRDCVRADANHFQHEWSISNGQLNFAVSMLTRQFGRIAGLRLYAGDLAPHMVVPFIQAEVDAIDNQLKLIRSQHEKEQ